MYSDRIAASGGGSRKRSVKDRLGGITENEDSVVRQNPMNKRFRQDGAKWQHDLYDVELDNSSITKNDRRSTEDLRSKLNKTLAKGSGTASGVKDLREKLSGTTATVQAVSKSERPVSTAAKESTPTVTVVTGKKPIVIKANIPPKAPATGDFVAVSSFLQSLGLSKYAITFQAEEIDMSILRHMSGDDLKELGVPMGPRKKILLALASQAK